MKLYETNNMFRKNFYVNSLKKLGIACEVADKGVLINIEEYKEKINLAKADLIVFMNHQFVKQLY